MLKYVDIKKLVTSFFLSFGFIALNYIILAFEGVQNVFSLQYIGKDAVIGGAIFWLLQLLFKHAFSLKNWIIPGLHYVCILGIYTFLLIQTENKSYEFIHPYYLWALYGVVSLVSLNRLLGVLSRIKYLILGVYMLLILVDAIGLISTVGYYHLYGDILRTENVLPVLQTNSKEAVEFLVDRIGITVLGIIICLFFCGIYFIYHLLKQSIYLVSSRKHFYAILFINLFLAIVSIILLGKYIPKCMPYAQIIGAHTHIQYIRKAGEQHVINLQNFQLLTNKNATLARELPGSVIVVIGESETRDRMKAFNSSYHSETTPWLSKEKTSTNFFLFNKAYANFPVTVPSLSMYLYGDNQYNKKDISEVVNIMDVARAAGYTTWWISNQARLSSTDSVIDFVASNADHELRTVNENGDDAQLLDLLQQVPTNQSNFIVMHMMGSHVRYTDRLPKGYQGISNPNQDKRINTYDSTILYTDQILQAIWEYGRNNLNLQVMTYCSDHGENMEHSHVSSKNMTWDMVRVPLFVYVSPAYVNMYPHTIQALKEHEQNIFTNDLMFDTISGLMQAPNTDYEIQFDLSSQGYNLPFDKALTKHGEWRIMDDPDLDRNI